jgi:hypothetical protein
MSRHVIIAAAFLVCGTKGDPAAQQHGGRYEWHLQR